MGDDDHDAQAVFALDDLQMLAQDDWWEAHGHEWASFDVDDQGHLPTMDDLKRLA